MRMFLMAVVAALATVQSASAQTSRWSGGYLGAHAGVTWGNYKSPFSAPDSQIQALIVNTTADSFAAPGSHDLGSWGGGLQLGFNWLLTRQFLVGLEGDFSFLDLKKTKISTNDINGVPTTPEYTTTKLGVDWLSTLRGRAGVVIDRSMLLYATGGLAFGRVSQSHLVVDGSGTSQLFSGSEASVKTGYTVGAGFEYALTSAISLKAEYLYVNFNLPDVRTTSFDGQCSTQCTFVTGGNSLNMNVARVGFNYRY